MKESSEEEEYEEWELTEEGGGSGEEEDHKVKQVDSNRVWIYLKDVKLYPLSNCLQYKLSQSIYSPTFSNFESQ